MARIAETKLNRWVFAQSAGSVEYTDCFSEKE